MTGDISSAKMESLGFSDDATGAASRDLVHSPQDHFYQSKSGPAAEGARVADGLRAGISTMIDACVATLESKRRYQGDIEAVTAFLAPLVQAKVLSPSEARLGLASPKLSMLCKIGEYADRLRHPALLSYFLETGCYGHTQVYQIAVLLDQTGDERGEEARVEQLLDLLRRKHVETRQDMLHLTRELKRAKLGNASADLVSGERPTDLAIDRGDDEFRPSDAFRNTAAVEIHRDFDLILAIPRPSDLRKLQDYYEGVPPKCLRTGESVPDAATLVVVTALANLPVIVEKLIPFCGFGGVLSRVFLSRAPVAPEITGEQVIIVAERGSDGRAQVSEIEWLSQTAAINPLAIATKLVPDAKNTLFLFAAAETEGWRSLIGDSNWSQTDE